MFCNKCGASNIEGANYCSNCGNELKPANINNECNTNEKNSVASSVHMPMKWHYCLVYFGLWLGAGLTLLLAIIILAIGRGQDVYTIFPNLLTLDNMYGIVLLVFCGFRFYTAYLMLRMKRGAPKKLFVLLFIQKIVSLVYTILVAGIFSRNGDISSIYVDIFSSVLGLIVVFIYRIYYNKREHLFVN